MEKISNIIEQNKFKKGSQKAIVYRENDDYLSINYLEFYNYVNSFVAYLIEQGLENKKIAIIGNNKLEWLIAFYAVLGYIGTAVPLDKQLNSAELDNLLDFLEPDLLIYDDDLNLKTTKVKKITFHEVRELSAIPQADILHHQHHGTVIFQTSGSLGIPKSVVLSEENLLAHVPTSSNRTQSNSNDRMLLLLPLSHVYAMNCVNEYLWVGGTIMLESDFTRLNKAFQETKPTCFPGVPLIYNRIKEEILAKNALLIKSMIVLSNLLLKFKIDIRKKLFKKIHAYFGGDLRITSTGGSGISYETLMFFNNIGLPLYGGYGLTEASGTVSLNYPNNCDFHSAGKIMDMNEVIILDPDETGVGEIAIKGANVFSGYYNRDSTDLFVDGYFKTGDLGHLKNGFLYIDGRKKNVIIGANAKNIYPEEIEQMFKKYPKILSCKIIMKNERLHADIVSDLQKHDLQKLINKINKNLPDYKKIATFNINTQNNNPNSFKS